MLILRNRSAGTPRGFGLLEVLIAGVIMGIIGYGMLGLMKGMTSSQKRVDDKTKLADFSNRVRNLIFNEASCAATLLGGTNLEFDPTNLAAFNNDPAKTNVTLHFGGGVDLTQGNGIDVLQLKILNEALPVGSNRYEASLTFGAPDVTTGVIRPSKVTVLLGTVAGSTPGTLKIANCFSKTEVDPQTTCEGIGGRWIASLPRCFFGGDLKLNQNECINASEFAHGKPLEGSVVAECYYNDGGGVQQTYSCINRKGWFIPECTCGADGWAERFSSTSMFPNQVIHACDGGVLIRAPDKKNTFLLHNEIIPGTYVPAPPSGETGISLSVPVTTVKFLDNFNILDGITECYYEPDSIRTRTCQQGANATQGGYGSCVFVNGTTVRGAPSVNEAFVDNYTGWMFVERDRTLGQSGWAATRVTTVGEAVGQKCYLVKAAFGLSTSARPLSAPTTGYADPINTSTTNILTGTRWKDVSECVFLGGAGTGGNPIPETNGSYLFPPYGQYLKRFACNQEGIDVNNLVGGNNFWEPSSLKNKNCWYFDHVLVNSDYATNRGITATAGAGPWGSTGYFFTGWIYLTGNLANNGQYTVGAGTNVISINGGNKPTVFGVPCNLGMRMP